MVGVLISAGIDLGITALHPFTGHSIPVFAATYVVSEYGTKAVMGVPAHDDRDKIFADEHDLPSTTVNDSSESEEGVLLNSDQVNRCHNLIRYFANNTCATCSHEGSLRIAIFPRCGEL